MKLLLAITVALAALVPAYDRASWGRWKPTGQIGGNGCRWDTRQLLLRDIGRQAPAALTTREVAGKACLVLTLAMADRYTGKSYAGPANKIHVDHLVSLAEAHRSGAWAWGKAAKRAFYNDSDNHVATHGSVNSSKSDVDPGGESQRGRRAAGWWPPDRTQHCWYARKWKSVKVKWALSSDAAESRAVAVVLRGCAPALLP